MWLFVFFIIVVVFIVPAIFQWLWNETMPDLFRLPLITYWQAFRLLLIAAILIGGPGVVHVNLGG